MSRFLIIQTAFLGDVVLALPVAQHLREQHPDATIHMVVRSGNESVLHNHPAIDHIHTWNKREGKYKNLFRLAKVLRQYTFDEVINLQRFAASGWLTLLMKSKVKKGFDKNPLSRFYTKRFPHSIPSLDVDRSTYETVHEVQRNLQLVAGPHPPTHRPQLYPTQADREKVAEIVDGRDYFVIAPASVWFTKQWPAGKWKALLAHLPQQKAVFFIGSKADKKLADQLLEAHPQAENLCGELSMLQSAALMEKAIRVFVNDSGPLHFASGVNAKVTAIFCSTIPEFGFGPLSDEAKVVQEPGTLPCRPCGLHGKRSCPLKHFKCAHDIPITAVFTPQEWETVLTTYPSTQAINYEIGQRLWQGATLQLQTEQASWWLANPLIEEVWQKLSDTPVYLLYTDQRMLNQYAHSMPDRYFELLDLMHQQPLSVHLPFLKNVPEIAQKQGQTYWLPVQEGPLANWLALLDRPLLAVPGKRPADLQWTLPSVTMQEPQRVAWDGQQYIAHSIDSSWERLQQFLAT